MRSVVVALLGLVFWGVAAGAWAQSGLQRFESEIKPQIELKKFTYGSASALGSAGFVLNDVVAVVPASPATGDKESTIKIDKVTVDELDFDRLKKGASGDDVPRFAKLKIEGLTGDDAMFAALAPYGVPRVPVDVALDYRLDTATKVLTLSKLEVSLRGQSRVALALVLEGISDKSSQMQGAKDNARLRTASLDIDDTGLIAKVLPAVAKSEGATPEAMAAMATVPLAAFTVGQGPATLKALDSVVSFITDWRRPKGPIKFTIKPAKTASLADLDKVAEPNALTDIFGLTVDYAGTRVGAAGGSVTAPSTPQAATAPPVAGEAKPMTGGEAWLSIVGNTLTGKIDGEVFFEFYRKDGTLTLMNGSDLTKGKWTIEGEKVCFKYPDDDKECFTVSRKGDEITLGGDKGKGLRLTLLPGNPKDL
ncbi:MAG: hypothetical protein PSV46_09030 [Reyranella sp.]|nr:hypothetical protein [Reyranella sp.]